MATYWENSCSFGLRYVSWYEYLIVSLVFSHLGFWSGNLFLIAPFPDLCLLVPLYYWAKNVNKYMPFDKGTKYSGWVFSFTKPNNNEVLNISYIEQEFSDDGWTTFILDESKGFTRAGIERINDSIRTYCWAILGSQAQTRTGIIGVGTQFDTQKQF